MSLRARLLTGLALVVVMLGLVGVVVTFSTRDQLIGQVDEQLIRAIDNAPAPASDYPRRQFRRDRKSQVQPDSAASLFIGWYSISGEALGTRLPTTTRAEPAPPAMSAETLQAHADQGPFTVKAGGNRFRYRVIVSSTRSMRRDADLGPDRVAHRVYGLPLESVDATVDRLVMVEVIASLSIVALLGLVAFWVLRLGVGPLKVMTKAAAKIGEGDLSSRVPPSKPGTEAGDLGVALNKMLGRIEGAFDKQAESEARLRRFVADASHELRTPLTTIRGYAELYRRGGLASGEPVDEAMRRTEEEAIRMGALVEDLLSLARLDEQRPLDVASVDLSSVITDAASDAQAVEPTRPITVTIIDQVDVVGDQAKLRQVVANLLNNVRVHTLANTPVELRLRQEGSEAVIEVIDQGPGMDPVHAGRAFERFYRADPARSRHNGGSGLGLSIVASVLNAHGGRAEITSTPGFGTTVTLRIPLDGSRERAN